MINVYDGIPDCGLRLESGHEEALDLTSTFRRGTLYLWLRARPSKLAKPGEGRVPLTRANAIALRNALNYALDKEVLR